MTAAIDAVLRAVVERGEVAGVAAAAGGADGTLYEGAFGLRGLDQQAAMAADTVVWIASMAKAVTTVAAMRRVEAGRLSLDALIGTVLPALADPQVLEGWDPDGDPACAPRRARDLAWSCEAGT